MVEIIVTRKDSTTYPLQSKGSVVSLTKAEQSVELLGGDVINISLESIIPQDYTLGDKITVLGRDYKLNLTPGVRKISTHLYRYDLVFEGIQYDLTRAHYDVNIDTTGSDLTGDALTGDLERFLDVLILNISRLFPGEWELGDCPETDVRTLVFSDGDNCLAVLQRLCQEYQQEFEVVQSGGMNTIHIRTVGIVIPHTFSYGRGNGLYELTRQKVSTSNIVNRLKVFGSEKNITSKYRCTKLCLPGKTKAESFLEDATSISQYGIWEATKTFNDIFPQRVGSVTGLGGSELELIDSTMFNLTEKDIEGNNKWLLAGTSAKLIFNTGNLAGYDFEVYAYDHATKKFTLRPFTDERDMTFPSEASDAFQFAIGDKYVLLDITMPDSYVTAAEDALEDAGDQYLSQNCQPKVKYGLTIDPMHLKNLYGGGGSANVFWVGDYVPIKDTDIGVDKSIRIKSFTRNLLSEWEYNLTIADISYERAIINRVISDSIEVNRLVRINNLGDTARARRSWKSTQEVLGMMFDPDGDYFSEKIKPLSIETGMLATGVKSMQFVLQNTLIEPNYQGVKSAVRVTGGTISHYTIADEIKSWNIASATTVSLVDATAYYMYAKCEKAGTGCTVIFSATQIVVDSDVNYYHFLIGVLNSVVDGVRSISLMYGSSTINGRFIKTGRIQSADGLTFFDLDTGDISGKITFQSGKTDTQIETAITTAQNTANTGVANAAAADAKAVSAQSDADDAYTYAGQAYSSAGLANSLLSDIASDSKLTPDEKQATKKEWDIIVSEKIKIDASADEYAVSKTAYGSAYSALSSYITPLLSSLTTTSNIVGSDFRNTFRTYYDARQDLLNAISAKAKLLADTAQNEVDNLAIGGVNLVPKALIQETKAFYGFAQRDTPVLSTVKQYTFSAEGYASQAALNAGKTLRIFLYSTTNNLYGGTWDQSVVLIFNSTTPAQKSVTFTPTGNKPFFIFSYCYPSPAIGDVTATWYKLEEGTKATRFSHNDIKEYATTVIDGGIVTSGRIQLGDEAGTINAGIAGDGTAGTSIRMWAGATFINRATAPFRVNQDGALTATNVNLETTLLAGQGSTKIENNEIWENAINGDSYLWINRLGYNKGATQQRGLLIGDGKGNQMASLGASCVFYTGLVNTSGRRIPPLVVNNADTYLNANANVILCNNTSGITIYLKPLEVVDAPDGQVYLIKRCNSGGVTINGYGRNILRASDEVASFSISNTHTWQIMYSSTLTKWVVLTIGS